MNKKILLVGIAILGIMGLNTLLIVNFKTEDRLSKLAVNVDAEETSSKLKPRLSILPTGDNPKLGVDSARVKMIAFVDYQCGYCKIFVQEQLPFLLKNYVEKNLVQITFRDYPLSFHENAELLAKAGHIATENNDFTGFLDKVWEFETTVDSTAIFRAFGNPEISDEKSIEIDKRIEESKFLAGVAGISATPTFIINDRMLVGLRDLEELKAMIDYSMKDNIPVEKSAGACGG